jgi:hypothetical protein
MMKLALKLHGVAMIALILSLSIGIDLCGAYLIAEGAGAEVFRASGISFNSAQVALCIITLTMSAWKAGGGLHITDAFRGRRYGAAVVASIPLTCSIVFSVSLAVSWCHVLVPKPAELRQLGVNLPAAFGSEGIACTYAVVALGVIVLQLGTVGLPIIVFGRPTKGNALIAPRQMGARPLASRSRHDGIAIEYSNMAGGQMINSDNACAAPLVLKEPVSIAATSASSGLASDLGTHISAYPSSPTPLVSRAGGAPKALVGGSPSGHEECIFTGYRPWTAQHHWRYLHRHLRPAWSNLETRRHHRARDPPRQQAVT